MTLKEALIEAEDKLREKGIIEASIDAWYLLKEVIGYSRAEFLLESENAISPDVYKRFNKLLEQRSKHIPLQYILGYQEFMGLKFLVSKDTLIPRQDTEILVEAVGKICSGKAVLDVCTGSGCIIISLVKLYGVSEATAVDLSSEALLTAKKNGLNLNASITWLQSDLYANVTGTYDVIVSNPPYIRSKDIDTLMKEVRVFEPRMALDGMEDGLFFYRKIVEGAHGFLKKNGYIFFEIGYDQAEDVTGILLKNGFTDVETMKDYAGLDRVVKGRWD